MTRIHRQLSRDTLFFLLVTCAVVLGLLAIGQLAQFLNQVAAGQLPLSVVLQFLGLAVPTLLVTVLPLAFFFGVYLTFNRLYRSNEMVAIRGAGQGLTALLWPIAWIAIPVIILELLLALWWAPASQRHLQAESSRLANAAAEALLQPGTFTVLPSGRVIYVGKAITSGAHRFQEIFVASTAPGSQDLATAAYGEVKPEVGGALTLVLVNGQRYLGEPGQAGFKVLAFSRYRVSLGAQTQPGAQTGGVDWGSAPLAQLWRNRAGPDARFAVTELEWRLVWPLALPLLALLAIPLAYTEPRGGGRAAGLLLGILFLLLINNLLIFVKDRMESGMMALFPGFLLVLLLLLTIAIYGFARRARDLPLLPSLRRGGR